MRVVLLSNDLMTCSQIEGAVRAGGSEISVATTASAATAEGDSPDVVILDLSTAGDIAATVSQFRELASPPRIIAFGPHVHAAKLAAAREAGCDDVFTRGQFLPNVANALGLSRD